MSNNPTVMRTFEETMKFKGFNEEDPNIFVMTKDGEYANLDIQYMFIGYQLHVTRLTEMAIATDLSVLQEKFEEQVKFFRFDVTRTNSDIEPYENKVTSLCFNLLRRVFSIINTI